MMAQQMDMTTGSPGKILFEFTIPVFIGNVFQQFYNMVDTMIVGKFVGTEALAAVGSTSMIMFLILGFVWGMTAGVTVLTAQKFGCGDMKAMRRTVGSAVILSAAVTAVLTVATMAGMRPLLKLMQTPQDIFADAYVYIMIICGGICAQMLYNLLACLLRALGNSRVPLYFLILSALMNIVLDLAFIIIFQMGTAGAAWATVISQGVSGLLCLAYIARQVPLLHLGKDDFRPDLRLLGRQIGIGLPMALQYSITAIGGMMVQTSLNLLGSLQVAAYTAAGKIEQIANQAFVAMGTATATYSAQNIGAGNVRRIRQGFRSATLMGCAYAVVIGFAIAFGGKYMTYLFVSENVTAIMGLVDIYLKCTVIFLIPLMIVNVYRNGIQGMGYGLLPMTAGVAELIGRGVVAVIAAGRHSYMGVCLASPAAWMLAGGLLLVMYVFVMRRNERKFGVDDSAEHRLAETVKEKGKETDRNKNHKHRLQRLYGAR